MRQPAAKRDSRSAGVKRVPELCQRCSEDPGCRLLRFRFLTPAGTCPLFTPTEVAAWE